MPASPVGVTPYGSLRCLYQQEAQQRVALLSDTSQPTPIGAGIFTRDQPDIALSRERFVFPL